MTRIKSAYYPLKKIERLLYAVEVWNTLSVRQKGNIYDMLDELGY